MKNKSKIIEAIEFILNSSKKRNTEQGVLVCENTITKLSKCNSDSEILKTLKAYNKAYAGIEAHGYLTNTEYEVVTKLRNIESNYA